MVPEYISDLIPPFVRDKTNYLLRNRNDLTVPINRTEIFRNHVFRRLPVYGIHLIITLKRYPALRDLKNN